MGSRVISTLLLLTLVAPFSPASAWNLNFFTSHDDNTVSLHPSSPKEQDEHAVRLKRQAYQVYVGGDTSVSVDKGGQAESGVWGQWTKDSECSRTCGGGVFVEKRQCNGECTGPSVRYVSCNIDPCEKHVDFRAEQCSKHNDDPLDGNYYKWLPYPGKNKCELTCKPDTADFYYKWADKVVDGTKCGSNGDDICVDGVCLPLGCDGKLGSEKKSDKCGACGGDGSTCKTVEGFFDERNLTPGYHNIIILPVGATSVKIEEMRPTSNSLALKNSSDHFYLNGNFQIEVMDKEIKVGGNRFKYEKAKDDATERLTAKGPLDEEITVALLFQRGGSKDSAIKYEFSVPLDQDVPYLYKPGEWSQCSVTCGKGVQTRTPFCIDTGSQQRVDDNLCEENNSTKPEVEKECETVDCEAEWFQGEWEPCSQTCGDQGQQYRVVYCHKIYKDGRRMTVDDDNCTASRPEVKQSCNRFNCPEWQAGPWSACSEKCGDAKQYRSVTCRSEKEGEEGKLLAADACGDDKMDDERGCNLGPCEGLNFFTSEWQLCERCNDTEETRNVTCKDKTGRQYQLEKCLNENVTDVPIDVRSCATVQPCNYEWHASEWSKCSTECGHGHKTRRVNCAIAELGGIEVVDEGLCQSEKPEAKTNCTNEEKCTGTYFSSPWSKCSDECGGGSQTRVTVCLNYDKQPVPEWCDEAEKPAEEQPCNEDPCPTCFDSEFGCCPDNSTFAQGDWFDGCSNCSLSDFGCCNDNITEATGPNSQGCPEFVEAVEGSGEEDAAVKELKQQQGDEADKECEVTNEATGETVKLPCDSVNATVDELDLFLSNDTDENQTIHCSKTEFGCCPDWYTPSEGAGNAGCPEFTLGSCNETQHGCCLDEVTLARGPNFEGCGEPSCAASLFGCCKDRKTIAFGPHYAGCERSSFPCELSSFGCCPDGETAALGKNGTGCGANCLVTKFGCCPDGVTVAKGLSNEGCGCEFAQFGCCPDGKTAAKGASFYGCPNTCAQSQYGCCPDGKTASRGTNKEGCPCQYTRYGCCPDGETTSLGPNNDGCDDCRYAKYACCPDGEHKALGPDYQGCPSTTVAPFLSGGTVAPSKIVSCSQPQDQGNVCHPGYKLVWFYDPNEGRCSQFWYGGCGGNENKFATKEMCETICVEPPSTGRCYLPKIEGPQRCNQLVARYWYDHSTKQCAAFWWRGCQGNANNFDTWESCQTFCSGVGPIEAQPPQVQQQPQQPQQHPQQQQQLGAVVTAAPAVPEIRIESQPQPAQAQYPPQQQQQQPQVQAATPQDQTQIQLQRPAVQQAKSRDACGQRMDVGRCQGHFPAYYYEPATGSCQNFEYSGCGGNSNRFHTKEQCEDFCLNDAGNSPASPGHAIPIRIGLAGAGRVSHIPQHPGASGDSPCEHPKDTGSCNRFVTKWYYNKADGTCNRFHYGGCEGNTNRFETEQECRDKCGEFIDRCMLPRIAGPCAGKNERFFFNPATKDCESFTFGGCLGNLNNFRSLEECKQHCGNQPRFQQYTSPEVTEYHPDVGIVKNQSNVGIIKSRCELPQDTGPCTGLIYMYYYNAEQKECQTFMYGGCLGNENRFDSMDDCEDNCGSRARHQLLQALTLPAYPEVYRNMNEDRGQEESVYTDNDAREEAKEYDAVDAAQDSYKYYIPKALEPAAQNMEDLETPNNGSSANSFYFPQTRSALPELCQLAEDRGTCYGEQLAYRFDMESRDCVSFTYTGCKHNANYFTSVEACQRACGPYRDVDVCRQPKETGHCHQRVSRWHFNPGSMKCEIFFWSGCGGNGNRFNSKEECLHLCTTEIQVDFEDKDVCKLERDTGPCTDALTQWYFDKTSTQCKKFTFGGCRGNGNRFNSKDECEGQCLRRSENLKIHHEHTCKLAFETGPCEGSEVKWFFDKADEVCRSFSYSGCGGNDNRFETEAACLNSCRPHRRTITFTAAKAVAPKIRMRNPGPYIQGTSIEFTCVLEGGGDDSEFAWFKNNVQLEAHLLADERVVFEDNNRKLTVNNVTQGDEGKYSCAAGKMGLLSELQQVVVKAPPKPQFCLDKGTVNTCELIKRTGLCSNERYGKFCCLTCTKHGFTF